MDCTALVLKNKDLAVADIGEKRVKLSATPSIVQIEVTNDCNLSCASCARNNWDADLNPVGDVALEVLDRLKPFLERASTIVPFGYGESLMSPVFPQVMRRLREINSSSEVVLFTNGLSITRQRLKPVFDHDVSNLCFSIDGADEESFRQTRGGSFNRLTHNIGLVRELRQQSGRTTPVMTASFTATALNIAQLPPLIRYCAEVGITSVGVSIARIFDPGQKELSLLASEARLRQAEETFEEAEDLSRSLGIGLGIPSHKPAVEGVGCLQPFNTMFVKWDGEVRLCCASAIVSRSPMYIVAGNLFKKPVEEIWNNSLAQKVRLGLLGDSSQVVNPICRSCPFNEASLENLCKFENLNGDSSLAALRRFLRHSTWSIQGALALRRKTRLSAVQH